MFDFLVNLTTLYVWHCLAWLHQLMHCSDISNNRLLLFPSLPFAACLGLQTLLASNNRLIALDGLLLYGLFNMLTVDLSHNTLTALPSNIFSNCTSLVWL